MEPNKFDRAIRIVALLIVLMAAIHIGWLIYHGIRWSKVVFEGIQYVALLLILVPALLKKRLNIDMPWMLFALIVVFCFSGFVMGDALNLYRTIPWWDDLLHIESGVLLAALGVWFLRVGTAKNDKPVYFGKWFLAICLILFSLGCAAFWECIEFSLDGWFGINMQQFMATTTGSLVTDADIPHYGREALYDTMRDIIYTLYGAVPAAIYCFIRHDKL